MDMRRFLINLDRDADRLQAVSRRFAEAGLTFERVSAVYGKDLPPDERRAAVRRLRFRLAMGRPVFDGEIGCALSHVRVLDRIVRERIPVACVFEDDVVFTGDVKDALSRVRAFVDPARPQVVLLSDHGRKGAAGGGGILRITRGLGTEAYVVTLAAAQALRRCLRPMTRACDAWDRWAALGAVELFGLYPAVTDQAWDLFESHIKPKERLKRTAWTRALSGFGKAVDRALLPWDRRRLCAAARAEGAARSPGRSLS